MKTLVALLSLAIAVLATPGRVNADDGVPDLTVDVPIERDRPLYRVRVPLRTCPDDGFRCPGLPMNWSGTILVRNLDHGRTLVSTGWGMRIHDGTSMSQQIVTAGVRQPVGSRMWVQAGAGGAQRDVSSASLDPIGGNHRFIPAVSGGVGFDLIARRTLGVSLAINGATGMAADERSVFSLNAGLNGRY